MDKEANTFSKFKESFYSRITDPSLFDCGKFNLIKVVLEGLKVNYYGRGIKTRLIDNSALTYFYYRSKMSSRESNIKNFKKNAQILILDVDRKALDEKGYRSYYFSDLLKNFREDDYLQVMNVNEKKDSFNHDLSYYEIKELYGYGKPLPVKLDLIHNVIKTFKRIRKKEIFSKDELYNIRVAFKIFIDKFLFWSALIERHSFKTCFLICHYHNEGLIAALKLNNIASVEFQHGIIAEEDIFYCMPRLLENIRSRSLFADKILVMGKYWKNKLLKGFEYASEDIIIGGRYFRFDGWMRKDLADKFLQKLSGRNKVVLITSQTTFHRQFIRYIKFLKKHILAENLNWIIVLKPHPSEDMRLYDEIKDENALVVDYNLHFLFSNCHAHVSVYSTTFFEALAYDIKNFSLLEKQCIDYIEALIKDGITIPLELNQPPDFDMQVNKPPASLFYEEVNMEIIMGLIKK